MFSAEKRSALPERVIALGAAAASLTLGGLRRAGRLRARTSALVATMPIRLRLMLLSFALVALLVGGLGALISISEEQTLLTTQAVALHREAHLAAGELHGSSLILAHDGQPLPASSTTIPASAYLPLSFLTQRLTSANTQVAILSPDGQVEMSGATLYRSYDVAPPAPVTLPASSVRQAFSTVPTDDSYRIISDVSKHDQLVSLLPIVDLKTHTTIAVLQISTSMQPITSAVTQTRLIVAISVAIALGLAAAVAFPLVSAGLRPLVTMERMSQRIANGALSLRLREPPTHDEIGRLARSFNSMVEQLETVIVRQEQFVADVSHELRTPLTALSGELEMLLLGADRGDVEAVRRLSRGMFAEVSRMRRLVEDLLTLTRLDEGQMSIEHQPLVVEPLMREIAHHAENLARGQEIALDVAPNLPSISADPDRLRQVLLNIVENAAKYTPAHGRIRLSARQATRGGHASVVIEVEDTGVGISRAALAHVFERFYRADPARARSAKQPGGAGLGLAIARSLVEAQGGEISLTSVEGSGTTVRLRFPADKRVPPLPAAGGIRP